MFISYAQNFEDVMLNRVFANKEQGIYIDVGAQHPLYDSVTKAFYDRGWHGVNIEPVKEYYELLVKERERDINLNLAVGETESELDFFELEGTGLSTFDQSTAERLGSEEGHQIISYQVPVVKLADIIHQHLNCPIDFLKIDVEGWEEKVILGNDWARFRPKVIVLEATFPNSPTRAETNIADILKGQNYQQVYFDGLNDYYLANESSDLLKHFATPPNVFDKFISYHLSTTKVHAKNLEAIIQARDEQINNIQQQLESKEQELIKTQQILDEHERHNHIFNNRLKDEQFETQRLTKVLTRFQNTEQKNRNNFNQEITQFKEQLTTKDQQLTQSQEQLTTKDQQLTQSQEQLTTKDQQLTQSQEQLTIKDQQLTQSQEQLTIKDQQLTLLKEQLTVKEQQLNQANELIAAMKTSKFWKIRSAWFGVKDTLGIKN